MNIARVGNRNVLIDGSLRDYEWYKVYFAQLRREYPNNQIAILHIVAPREVVFQRAAERAVRTKRVVPRKTLEAALEQVPKSVKILAPLADFFVKLNNDKEVEILTEDMDWDLFQVQWLQTCAWVPGGRKKTFSVRHNKSINILEKIPEKVISASEGTVSRNLHRSYSLKFSTESNHKSESSNFFGSYSHIRKILDYNYHCYYTKERQWLQNAIIEEMLKKAKINSNEECQGDVFAVPTNPWLVITVGVMGVGKIHTIRHLAEKGRFPLESFVLMDPEEAQSLLPEFNMYMDQCPELAEDMMWKEVGYISEILTLA